MNARIPCRARVDAADGAVVLSDAGGAEVCRTGPWEKPSGAFSISWLGCGSELRVYINSVEVPIMRWAE